MQDNQSIQFDDQRLAKRQQLIEEGVPLYPHEFRRTHTLQRSDQHTRKQGMTRRPNR
jgi:hypothetical protein